MRNPNSMVAVFFGRRTGAVKMAVLTVEIVVAAPVMPAHVPAGDKSGQAVQRAAPRSSRLSSGLIFDRSPTATTTICLGSR